jgi:hypothetical protein
VLAAARDLFLARGYAGTTVGALADPHRRLDRLVELSCETLARISPVHTVLRGAADGHPFAAGLSARMLRLRLQIQARNLETYLGRVTAARVDPRPGRRTLQRASAASCTTCSPSSAGGRRGATRPG